MKKFYFVAVVFIILTLLTAGCMLDPTGVVIGKNSGPTIAGTPAPAPSVTTSSPAPVPTKTSTGVAIAPVLSVTTQPPSAASGSDWILWREIPLDKNEWVYSMNRPNLDQRYFKDLKVEISTDLPVNVRFVTLKQCDEYTNEYDRYVKENSAYYNKSYDYLNPTTFNRERSGYVKFFQGISDTSVEAHGSEELVFILEPVSNLPVKGTMKIYYKL